MIQATLNVVLNAVQALDGEGKITLRTRVHRQSTIGSRRYRLVVAIDVIDNGPGIPEELRETCFWMRLVAVSRGSAMAGECATARKHLSLVDGCQRRSKSTPLAGVKMHHLMRFSPALAVVPVVHRRDARCFV